MDRRTFLAALGAAACLPAATLAQRPSGIVMWHAPGCGCCLEWARRMRSAFGAEPAILEAADMAAVKRLRGVPADLASCHTAMVAGYVIEGHVPPADIRRLIASRNRTIKGLAVPGMPAGSPGMDVGHDRRDPYQVIAFAADGRRSVFARYPQG